MGLVTSLLMTMLLFEIGIARTENQYVCIGIGMTLHWFLLSTFVWMIVCSWHMHCVFSRPIEIHAQREVG